MLLWPLVRVRQTKNGKMLCPEPGKVMPEFKGIEVRGETIPFKDNLSYLESSKLVWIT